MTVRPSSGVSPGEPGRKRPFFLGVAAGCGASLILFFALLSVLAAVWLLARDGPEELPRYKLTVADDGCGVIRSDPPGKTPDMLTWVVTDEEGFQVLGRLAESETRYRYYVAGNYDVVLKASNSEKYVNVSNKVSIQCP